MVIIFLKIMNKFPKCNKDGLRQNHFANIDWVKYAYKKTTLNNNKLLFFAMNKAKISSLPWSPMHRTRCCSKMMRQADTSSGLCQQVMPVMGRSWKLSPQAINNAPPNGDSTSFPPRRILSRTANCSMDIIPTSWDRKTCNQNKTVLT